MNDNLLRIVANGLGLGGMLICLTSIAARLVAGYYLFGFEAITLFITGLGLIGSGCFVKLHALEQALAGDA